MNTSKEILFQEDNSLELLIKRFDKINTSNKIAIIIDKKEKFKGIITSGDLRRIVQQNKKKSLKISTIMNKEPLCINYEEPIRKIQNQINIFFNEHNKKINFLIEIDSNKKFQRVINISDFINDFNNYKISIIGLGKVGLTLMCFLSQKHLVIDGIDINAKLINNLKLGKVDFYEPDVDLILKKSLSKKIIEIKKNYIPVRNNILIVCIGPNEESILLKDQGITKVFKDLAHKINKNDLIILRSTSPIGLSRKIIDILEKKSGYKCGTDFYFSYSPERAVEGNIIADLKNIPQIISGFSDNCLNKAKKFWQSHCSNIISAQSLEAAEIIKLTNNTYRDFSFAFSNILGHLCSQYNIDTNILIQSANNGYPRSNLFYPSPGVGGYCLSKDPHLFANAVDDINIKKNIIGLRKLNRNMALYPYKHVKSFAKKYGINIKKIKILIIGFTFKGLPENDDIRHSSSAFLLDFLKKKHIHTKFYDYMLRKKNISIDQEINPTSNFKNYDVFLIMNNHPNNVSLIQKILSKNLTKNILIFDGWSQLNKDTFNKNVIYSSIGQINY